MNSEFLGQEKKIIQVVWCKWEYLLVGAQVTTPQYDSLKDQTDGHSCKEYDEGHSNQKASHATIRVLTTTTNILTHSRPEEDKKRIK